MRLHSNEPRFVMLAHVAVAALLVGEIIFAPIALAAEYHVRPNGLDTAPGSLASPLSLTKALSSASPARPGDTVWLHGGIYEGPFISSLTGQPGQPIIVRQYPGERATIDCVASNTTALTVNGAWTWYWGFEVMNSSPDRTDTRGTGITIYGANTRFINLVVHDTGVGMGFWTPATNSEISGCIIYNNGWQGPVPDRGHGHAIYAQNDEGTKLIRDNVMFNQFGWGVHIYTQSGSITGFDLEGNVSFNNGIITRDTNHNDNYLIGGYQPAARIQFNNNFGYHTLGQRDNNVQFGYLTSGTNNYGNSDITATNNYIVGGGWAVQWWTNVTFLDNNFIGNGYYIPPWPPSGSIDPSRPYNWDCNQSIFATYANLAAYTNWTTAHGYDAHGTAGTNMPTQTKVFIRPNAYETNRANVVVFNWGSSKQVAIDPKGVLPVGASFELRNAENFFDPPVLVGRYSGQPISLSMTNLAVVKAVGVQSYPAPTSPQFNVFVLLPGTSNVPLIIPPRNLTVVSP